MEKAGVPTSTVISMPFAFKTRREAESLGMPDLPLIVLPHPLSSKPVQMIRALAEQTLDEVEYALVGSSEQVASRYHLRVTPFEPAEGRVDK